MVREKTTTESMKKKCCCRNALLEKAYLQDGQGLKLLFFGFSRNLKSFGGMAASLCSV